MVTPGGSGGTTKLLGSRGTLKIVILLCTFYLLGTAINSALAITGQYSPS